MRVAFTAAGLEALGVSPRVLAGFSREFLTGMTDDNRSRRLGDIGRNAPSRWQWGGAGAVPHHGPWLSPADARQPGPPDDPERGLHFIGLNANISRQFEFLQNAWMMSPAFSGLTRESDPLLGNREAIGGCPVTDNFNMPQDGGVRRRVTGVPQFVTVRGGAYFFLPGLRALRYFAGSSNGT